MKSTIESVKRVPPPKDDEKFSKGLKMFTVRTGVFVSSVLAVTDVEISNTAVSKDSGGPKRGIIPQVFQVSNIGRRSGECFTLVRFSR